MKFYTLTFLLVVTPVLAAAEGKDTEMQRAWKTIQKPTISQQESKTVLSNPQQAAVAEWERICAASKDPGGLKATASKF
jgi:hypothetical protein